MDTNKILPPLILAKLREQVELVEHLLTLAPPDKIAWQPMPDAFCLGDLLGHLLECSAGFCATLYALHSDRLAHFARLRERPVNHRCGIDEARQRLSEYMTHIEEGFALVTDEDLARRIPTVFVPGGEALLTILLGNLEHLINHKYQLFFYLKLLGVTVATPDLYSLRGQ